MLRIFIFMFVSALYVAFTCGCNSKRASITASTPPISMSKTVTTTSSSLLSDDILGKDFAEIEKITGIKMANKDGSGDHVSGYYYGSISRPLSIG